MLSSFSLPSNWTKWVRKKSTEEMVDNSSRKEGEKDLSSEEIVLEVIVHTIIERFAQLFDLLLSAHFL
jgi:hypothetical protein